jgi:hypothetical protein
LEAFRLVCPADLIILVRKEFLSQLGWLKDILQLQGLLMNGLVVLLIFQFKRPVILFAVSERLLHKFHSLLVKAHRSTVTAVKSSFGPCHVALLLLLFFIRETILLNEVFELVGQCTRIVPRAAKPIGLDLLALLIIEKDVF